MREKSADVPVRIAMSNEHEGASIYFIEPTPGLVARQIVVDAPWPILLDFDREGSLISIEFLNPVQTLPPEFIHRIKTAIAGDSWI